MYSKIGPKRLNDLVNRFYNLVFNESQIAHLFTTDPEVVIDKQVIFLTQFLGGPQVYTEKFGAPRMKKRHMPHAIDEDARIEWLRCMRKAIREMDFEPELADALYSCFPKLAAHMQNR
ncbi:MAG: hemoglobin [Flavobacteriaceae bacterium]|jgi:hemoglobin